MIATTAMRTFTRVPLKTASTVLTTTVTDLPIVMILPVGQTLPVAAEKETSVLMIMIAVIISSAAKMVDALKVVGLAVFGRAMVMSAVARRS
ncbi:MAG TPA: hypothetical protein VN956_21035 [Pyrinomonadaceae bacterium]|nr:hypothetical protein [Pyrinomonadaceae bacterium]